MCVPCLSPLGALSPFMSAASASLGLCLLLSPLMCLASLVAVFSSLVLCLPLGSFCLQFCWLRWWRTVFRPSLFTTSVIRFFILKFVSRSGCWCPSFLDIRYLLPVPIACLFWAIVFLLIATCLLVALLRIPHDNNVLCWRILVLVYAGDSVSRHGNYGFLCSLWKCVAPEFHVWSFVDSYQLNMKIFDDLWKAWASCLFKLTLAVLICDSCEERVQIEPCFKIQFCSTSSESMFFFVSILKSFVFSGGRVIPLQSFSIGTQIQEVGILKFASESWVPGVSILRLWNHGNRS